MVSAIRKQRPLLPREPPRKQRKLPKKTPNGVKAPRAVIVSSTSSSLFLPPSFIPSHPIFDKKPIAHSIRHATTRNREEAAAKKAEAARKKQEREAQLAEENSSARAAPKNAKSAASKKVSKGTLDLGKLSGDADADDGKPKKAAALNASGVENALDALSLTKDASTTKIERHPERRFAAAYRAYEERRLPEIEVEHPGLRKNQRVNICRDEFKKHPDNPFNQVKVSYDATQEEVKEAREAHREAVEKNLR